MKALGKIAKVTKTFKISAWRENITLRQSLLAFLIFLALTLLLSPKNLQLGKIVGIGLLVLGTLFALAIYLYKYQKEVLTSSRLVLLLGLILVTLVFAARIITPFFPGYLIPVAGIAMLVTILFDYKLAIVTVLGASIFTGIITGNHSEYIMVGALSGLLAVYTVSQVSERSELTRAGFLVSIGLAYLTFAVSLVMGHTFIETLRNAGWGLLSGISSAVLTIGTLPFLESVFHITTPLRLLELSSPNQPLLKELMINAPGTYNHSIVAGNLVEGAAEAIGANPLLARVGAYYHDIGKMKRPFFFIENQLNDNEHDKINPNLSCLIITAHVKEGVEIAKENKLPQEIIEIIQEHHGTTIVSYFYHRAKERIEKQEISEDDFRYSGIKPRSKEAALVMLADSVEAAARTMAKPSLNRLEQLIRKITQSKLHDGQLDESELTLADLEKIVRAFTQVLASVYHYRIEYPKAEVRPFKRRLVARGNPNRQLSK